MNDFEIRLAPGKSAEVETRRHLSRYAKCIVLNGSEHTHPELASMLRRNKSDAALFVRFAPDGIMLINNNLIYYDVKVGSSIEKAAWMTYLKYVDSGCPFVLLIKYQRRWYKQYVERIRLIHGVESIEQYPPEMRFPVDEDGWIHPRRSGRNVSNNRMSGTPYRYIDMDSLELWEMSKEPLLWDHTSNRA